MSDTTPATLLRDRALLRISGEDVRGFLQGLVTQDMAAVTPRTPKWSGLLSPQGKALFDFILWDGEDGTVLIDCESEQRAALARRLTLYRLRRAIEITPVDDLAVHWSAEEGPGVADPRLAELGWRWLGAVDAPAATGWLAHRLHHGVTEGVAELGHDKTLWLECNARELDGVRFDKGCFIGQENSARMHYRGKVNRRLVVLPMGEAGDRTRAQYPELGLMVEHRRIDDLGAANIPGWLAEALAVSTPSES
ncbi:YgfZ/GcvT domain-containing protein [Sphingosinithalassobacter portus]|uniref:CAF17-like 4Fe-4S cluster assembly/insertion protein YgfZ n=1 Tax=Stakelama portus TaxID=2676234 RepID=UPI000D6DE1F5|nr:folate-binding protein YgfZ [Sphingosinithalassobacter portus]